MIKTLSGNIGNINKGSILGDLYELELKSNKETRLSGSDVLWWSDKKNSHFTRAWTGQEPIYDATENAISFSPSGSGDIQVAVAFI